MSIGRILARGLGYVLLLLSLPEFSGLYVLFNSKSVSPFFLQNLSSTVKLLTGSALVASFLNFSALNYLLVLSGLVAIAGAALIIIFSDGYTGLSKVGTEILILSIISLISVYVIFNLVLPNLISHFAGSSGTSSLSSLITTLSSPLTSQIINLDIAFIVIGAVLVALRFILQKLKVMTSKKAKKSNVKKKEFFLYRFIGVPSGVAVVIVLLLFVTVFSATGVLNSNPYHYAQIPSNSVSSSYQSLTGTPQIFNLSDYYFLKSANMNSTYGGSIKLSPAVEPLPFSLPMSFSVIKFLDPIRFDFGLNLSNFSNIVNTIGNANISLPKYVKLDVIFNDSGITTCSNVNSGNGSITCNFEALQVNISKELLNINGTSVNRSILGRIFGFLTYPLSIFSGNVQNSSGSFIPQFTFVNHVSYNSQNCSLFNVSGTNSGINTSGQVCISDINGLPTFFSINEIVSLDNQPLEVNINFGIVSQNDNVTLNGINSLPTGNNANGGNGINASSGVSTVRAYVVNSGSGSGNGSVSVINTTTNQVIATIGVGYYPVAIALTPNGDYAYVVNQGGTVSVINTATNTVTATIRMGGDPTGIAITPDGKYAYITTQDLGKVTVIDIDTNTPIANISAGPVPLGVAITPNGQYAYVTDSATYKVAVINTNTSAVVTNVSIVGIASSMYNIAITPNGQYAYVPNNFAVGSVFVINTATNTETANIITNQSSPVDAAITPNGRYVYVTNSGSDSVSVINTSTSSVTAVINVSAVPMGIAITPNGEYAYVTNSGSGTVSVINTSTNTVVTNVTVGTSPLRIAIT